MPYPNRHAINTWAAWAMLCAHECAEGLGDIDRAELWLRRSAERYPDNSVYYFFWCKHRGHAAAPRAQAMALLPVLYERGNRDSLLAAGDILFVAGNKAEALAAHRKVDPVRNPVAGMLIAVAADLGKADLRNAAWQNVFCGVAGYVAVARLLMKSKPLPQTDIM